MDVVEVSRDVSLPFTDDTYTQHFMASLLNLRTEAQYTDVTLQTEGCQIPCHRVVLCAATKYFQAMFSSGMEECQSSTVEIKSMDANTLKSIVDYMYSSKINISTSNVQCLIQASDLFQFDGLKHACEMFMLKQVEPNNCIGMYQFASLYHLRKLRNGARHCMLTQFKSVVRSSEYLQLSGDDLIEYVADDELCVGNEDPVFEAVISWVQCDEANRLEVLELVMAYVRLPFCTSNHLCHVVCNSPFMNQPECQRYLEEARVFHILSDQRHEISSPRTVPRNSFNIQRRMVVVGGLTKEDKENRYCWYLKEETGSWELLAQLPRPNWKFYSVCIWQNGILVTGGYHTNVKKDCWYFDTIERKWKCYASLNVGRCKHRTVVHGGLVYAMGGEDDIDKPLSSVEYISSRTRQWNSLPNMPKGLSEPLCLTFGQFIYVFAGVEDDDNTSTTTLRYDPVWGDWTFKADMPQPCRLGAVTSINEKIYISGGYSRSCMSYSPKTDVWTVLTPPREKHGNAPAVVWKGKIIIGGGDVDCDETTSVVEEYDPETDEWSYWQYPLKQELSCHYMLNMDLYGI